MSSVVYCIHNTLSISPRSQYLPRPSAGSDGMSPGGPRLGVQGRPQTPG